MLVPPVSAMLCWLGIQPLPDRTTPLWSQTQHVASCVVVLLAAVYPPLPFPARPAPCAPRRLVSLRCRDVPGDGNGAPIGGHEQLGHDAVAGQAAREPQPIRAHEVRGRVFGFWRLDLALIFHHGLEWCTEWRTACVDAKARLEPRVLMCFPSTAVTWIDAT